MADRVIQAPSLTPTANAVDRYVRPHMVEAEQSGLTQLASTLSKVNPKLQGIIQTQYQRNAQADQAAGAVAESSIDQRIGLEGNKKGWNNLIKQVRDQDKAQGTDLSTELVGASPHFRQGLVKARANRIGLGLQSHLSSLWEQNEGGIKDIDDPDAVQQWVTAQTEAYQERMGVTGIDPLITQEVYLPRATQAQSQLLNSHMSYRARKRVEEYGQEMQANVGLLLHGTGTGSSDAQSFINRLGNRESSGDYQRVNTLGYTGLLQWGKDRLADYNRATGQNITMAQFRASDAIQDRANLWHIQDIDKAIDEGGYLDKGWSRDGLRAVAHLGGKGGMQDFVMSGGKHNPGDAYGTRLSDYYKQFSSPAAGLQNQIDEAISFGIDPKSANAAVVDGIVAEAVRSGDPALLSVLDELDTGNGPLGNITWVKEKRMAAAEKIEDDAWQRESREYTLEQRQREQQRREMTVDGYRAIMADPFADHSAITQMAIEMGHPELAMQFHNTQRQLQNEAFDVRTNHEAVAALRYDIYRGDRSDDDIASEIMSGVGVNFPQSTAQALFDDLEKGKASQDFLRDPDVQRHMTDVGRIVDERMTETDVLGRTIQSGTEFAYQAEQELVDELLIFLEDNPDASKLKVRKFMREAADELLSKDRYQRRTGAAQAGEGADTGNTDVQLESTSDTSAAMADPLAGFSEVEIQMAAENNGMTVDQYRAQVYELEGYTPPQGGSWWNPFD